MEPLVVARVPQPGVGGQILAYARIPAEQSGDRLSRNASDEIIRGAMSAEAKVPARRWNGMLLEQGISFSGYAESRAGNRVPRRAPLRTPELPFLALRLLPNADGAGFSRNGLLLAQALAEPRASDAGGSGPSSPGVGTGEAAGDNPESPGLLGWGLSPLRWGASTKTDFRLTSPGNGPRRMQRIETGNIKAASYLYQPWFAQVNGGLGLLLSSEHQSGGASVSGEQAHSSKSRALSGNGNITLFPVSRFPFNAFFDVSDSRAGGELISGDITSKRFGMRQGYRALEGGNNYTISFNRSTLDSLSFGRDTVNVLAGSMNGGDSVQSYNLNGSQIGNVRGNTGETTSFGQLNGRHSYRPDAELSVESLASLSNSEFRLLSAGTPVNNRSNFMQANTFATWRPEEDSPLLLSGGARLFRSVIANNDGAEAQSLSLGGNVAATYMFSRQTSVAGSATVSQLMGDGNNRLVTTQSANVNHLGDVAQLYGAEYIWNGSANVSNQTGLAEGQRQNLGGLLGHNLRQDLMLSENSQLNFGVGQSVGAGFDTINAGTQSLAHNANASWRMSSGAATSAYVSLLGSDSISNGRNANHFQLINFQASGQVQFSSTSSAAANLTVQGIRQSTRNSPRGGMTFNTNGNLSYFQQRAFDVPRLRYGVIYSANEAQLKSRLQGDLDAPRERVNQSFEQRLDYNVGRITFRASLRLARIEGRRDALIFFSMNREFGGY